MFRDAIMDTTASVNSSRTEAFNRGCAPVVSGRLWVTLICLRLPFFLDEEVRPRQDIRSISTGAATSKDLEAAQTGSGDPGLARQQGPCLSCLSAA